MSVQQDSQMTELEAHAVDRVRKAGVGDGLSERPVLSWIRSVGPEAIFAATLDEIRAVANAF